jgi:hypothetical protein
MDSVRRLLSMRDRRFRMLVPIDDFGGIYGYGWPEVEVALDYWNPVSLSFGVWWDDAYVVLVF